MIRFLRVAQVALVATAIIIIKDTWDTQQSQDGLEEALYSIVVLSICMAGFCMLGTQRRNLEWEKHNRESRRGL